MARFVSGDLTDVARRRVARYIDECEDCHREYMRHREFALKLERNLPTLGRPNAQRLDQLWSSLQTELQTTGTRRTWLGDFGSASSMQFSYGLVMVAVSIALLLPMVTGYHSSLLSVDLPPAPQFASVIKTRSTDLTGSPFIIATSQPGVRGNLPLLQNTPEPGI